jgi:hypothetical protein
VNHTSTEINTYELDGQWYKSYVFTENGSITIPSDNTTVDVLIVGGGGSGGSMTANRYFNNHSQQNVDSSSYGGGGGAGGVINTTITLSGDTYPIVVGAGGLASGFDNEGQGTSYRKSTPGNDGTNSSFNGLVAYKGGKGSNQNGNSGGPPGGGNGSYGSGGGGSSGLNGIFAPGSSIANGGVATTGQGYNGGNGDNGGSSVGGGGGGGAGGPGQNANASGSWNTGADGGPGISSTIRDGSLSYYAAGGGGGGVGNNVAQRGDGGTGGGGYGGRSGDGDDGSTPGSGGGGGGGHNGGYIPRMAGNGADGIVIIRFLIIDPSYNETSSNDTTSSWVGTATSDLDMGAYSLNAYSAIIGNIGSNNQMATLHVVGGQSEWDDINNGVTGYAIRYGLGLFDATNTGGWSNIAGYFDGFLVASSSIGSVSDRRIKKNIVDISDNQALELLRLIKPKRYQYIDTLKRTNQTVYGYIAQEVKEVLPYAVNIMSDCIPNIYEVAEVSGNTLIFKTFLTSHLDASSNTLKLYDFKNTSKNVTIHSIVNDSSVVIEEDITEMDLSNNQIFVYGQYVTDFHTLSKEHINTVAVSALQELDTQVQTLQSEKDALQTSHDALQTSHDALQTELTELKQLLRSNSLI